MKKTVPDVASSAFADDDSGWYLGAFANRLSADQDNVSDVDFEDSDTALGLKGGYMFTDLFGIEGGYLDLGDYNTRGNTQGIDLNLDAEGFEIDGLTASGTATFVDSFALGEKVPVQGTFEVSCSE